MNNLSKLLRSLLLCTTIACSTGNTETSQILNSSEKTSPEKKIKLADLKEACVFLSEARVKQIFELPVDAELSKPQNKMGPGYNCQISTKDRSKGLTIAMLGIEFVNQEDYNFAIEMGESGIAESLDNLGQAAFLEKTNTGNGEVYTLRLFTSGLQITFTVDAMQNANTANIKTQMANLAKEWLAENT